MQKNKIKGVKPFNDFFFKSCYYHQLMAGIACFGIDRDAILLNTFTSIQENFNIGKEYIFEEKKLEKLLGYRSKYCNISKAKLIRCIDNGCPVIMGVDCYYLPSRPDAYQNRHVPHFILAYGYDLDEQQANVVDHDYRNSSKYQEKTISLEDLLLSNIMFRKGVLNRKHSCYILKRKRNIGSFDIWKYIDVEKINHNYEKSLKNLNTLRKISTCDLTLVQKNVEKIIGYLNDLKIFYYALSKTTFFIYNQEKLEPLMALVSAYSNVLSLFLKVKEQNKYDYITKHLDGLLRKLNEIETFEKVVYDYLVEVKQRR